MWDKPQAADVVVLKVSWAAFPSDGDIYFSNDITSETTWDLTEEMINGPPPAFIIKKVAPPARKQPAPPAKKVESPAPAPAPAPEPASAETGEKTEKKMSIAAKLEAAKKKAQQEEEDKKKKAEEDVMSKLDATPIVTSKIQALKYYSDPNVYWTTTVEGGVKTFTSFDEKSSSTEAPKTQVIPKGKADKDKVWPIVLPPGWSVAVDADDAAYFYADDGKTAYVVPSGSTQTIPVEPKKEEPKKEEPKKEEPKKEEEKKKKSAPSTPREKAEQLLRDAIAANAQRRSEGKRGVVSRARLFRNKTTGSYHAVASAEPDWYRNVLKDSNLEIVAPLTVKESQSLGFDLSAKEKSKSRWNAVVDASSGKNYFVNIESKEVSWNLEASARIVGRIVPPDHHIVIRHGKDSVKASEVVIKTAEAMKEANTVSDEVNVAAAALALEANFVWTPSKEGWLNKSDSKGGNFTRRWIEVDGTTGMMYWYAAAPSSGAKYGAKVAAKGEMNISGATIEIPTAKSGRQFALLIKAQEREMIMCAFSEEDLSSWIRYLEAAATGVIKHVDKSAMSTDDYVKKFGVKPVQGWLSISSPDGKSAFTNYFCELDPSSRLVFVFTKESKAPGTECGCVDMLASDVFDFYPTEEQRVIAAPQAPQPSSHAFWIAVEDRSDGAGEDASTSVFGRGPGRTASSSCLVAESPEELKEWLTCLAQARDSATMVALTDEERSAAPILSSTLLHCQPDAGFFSSLSALGERKVIIVPQRKQMSVYTDAKGQKVAAVLELSVEGVVFTFGCSPNTPKAGYGNLFISITAPILGSRDGVFHNHIFHAHTSEDISNWASALAAL